jgi:TRAP-type C4-dicarboxylate transport system permease small subunit
LGANSALKRGVNRFSKILYNCVEIFCVLLLATVVCVVVLEVFMRYVANSGFSWTTEVGTLLLQYIAFTSMALGVKYKLHISLLIVYNRLSKKIQKVLDKFADICIFLFGIAFCYYGYRLTVTTWPFTLPATQWPQGLTYIISIFTGAIIVYESFVSFLGLNEEEPKAEEPDEKEGEKVV